MDTTNPSPFSLSVTAGCQRRVGASADRISRLYYDRPAFRALWDDYVVCQLGLQHWAENSSPEADSRRLEYTQTLRDLEWEIRRQIERSWDLLHDLVAPIVIGNASEILCELRDQHALRGREVYLSPLFPLIEMAWLGQRPRRESVAFINACGKYVCTRLGQLAGGLEVLGEKHLCGFISRFLECETPPLELRRLSELGFAYTRAHSNPDLVRAREKIIWRCCYQVASCNPRHAPNVLQWDRLLDLVPEGVSCRDFQVLASVDIDDMLADLKNAWAVA